jgi:hypothetical protein
MHNRKKFSLLFFVIPFSLFLMAWGYNGHNKINGSASLSFTQEMEQFQSWAVMLAEHASDADYRKDTDPNEGPRHYIDIDNYPGFATTGRIPQTYDSVVAIYGVNFVIEQGVLPWATKIAYDSLVNCLARFDWPKAVLFAADLGHYVGDAHNPLHITVNYNGQYTGNYGIHSRYETGMINAFKDEIIMAGSEISFVTDVNGYIFNYIYANYIYVDSVMIADTYAQNAAGNTTSFEYKQALWEKCEGFTTPLFNRAANTLAELIYSAWVEAGKPDMNSGPGIFERKDKGQILQWKISPNPVSETAKIMFDLPEAGSVLVKLYNSNGAEIKRFAEINIPEGPHEFSFNLSDLPVGVYFLVLESGRSVSCRKMVRISS